MFLSIRFVEGFTPEGWGGCAAHFQADGSADVTTSAGMCFSGYYNRIPWLRFSDIYVVNQPALGATLKVLVHELGHAAIWLLHLPAKWSKALDGDDTTLPRRRGKE